MYKAPNAVIPTTAKADKIQTELVCIPASNSAVESIGRNSPPTGIDIFNNRFFVPFRLALENRERVILGTDSMLRLGYTFQEDEGGEKTSVEKNTLMKTLSSGEKKALYVLNIIFEVEARRNAKQETLFIVDSPA